MKSATKARVVVGLGIVLAGVILARFGLNAEVLFVALACVGAAYWVARQFAPAQTVDPVADYELNLLARLDDPDPAVHHRAEMERDLQHWQRSH
jgi:hypothetical protein